MISIMQTCSPIISNHSDPAGGRVIGYVYSSYAGRPLQDVLDDIDAYATWYDIDGIFIDEMSNTTGASTLDFYESVYEHVKSVNPDWELMGNPGTTTAEAYFTRPVADRLMVWENYGLTYPSHAPSPWNANYPNSRFVNLLHTLDSAADALDYVETAVARNVGGVYFTDDQLGNPWDRLPSYWDEFVAKVAEVNGLATGPLETLSNPRPSGSLAVDGDRGDWDPLPAYAADSDEGPAPAIDLTSVTLANTAERLFVRVQLDASVSEPPTLGTSHRVFLDTDSDRGTGYLGASGEFALGADFMIRGDRLFAFQGASQQTFAWDFLRIVDADDSSPDDIELAAPLSTLGKPTTIDFFVQTLSDAGDDLLPGRAGDGALGGFFRYEVGAPAARGDYDGDGDVDAQDYGFWRARVGTDDPAADGNGDGVVDAADYAVWRDALGAAAPAATPTPTPTGFSMLITGAALGCAARIRKGRRT